MQFTRLYLLRHGPAAIPPGCLLGSTDAPLSGAGLERLNSLLPHLQAAEYWYCSPQLRARQTLAHLRGQGCLIENPVYDNRLREIDFGRWEMKTFTEIAAADPARVEAWQQKYTDFVFPEGEAVADFVGRTEEMLKAFSGLCGNVAAVTHGGVIRTMICSALGLPVRNYLLFDVQPASLTILELFSGGGVLRGLNL
jgi:broad specificity phosphatase PhoE